LSSKFSLVSRANSPDAGVPRETGRTGKNKLVADAFEISSLSQICDRPPRSQCLANHRGIFPRSGSKNAPTEIVSVLPVRPHMNVDGLPLLSRDAMQPKYLQVVNGIRDQTNGFVAGDQ
jgi:hypothetical protein